MGDASYPEDDDRGRLVSIIHEALKKIEGARHGYSSVRAGRAASVKRPQRTMTVALAVVTLFVVVLITLYTVWPEKKRSEPAQVTGQGEAARSGPALQTDASQPAALAVATEPQAWSDAKGIELFNLGRYSEAAAEFAEGVRQVPENSVRLNNLGLAYFNIGKTSEAEDAYKKALAVDPAYPEALNNYGALSASRADYGRAIKQYTSAIALRPDYAQAYLNRAIASELSGDLKTAVGDYERFLDIANAAKDAGIITEVRKKLLTLRTALIIEDVKGARR